MANTFYERSERTARTMTVGQLVEKLKAFDPSEPVIFRSPEYGCYGPTVRYSIDQVEHVDLPREENIKPARTEISDETGKEFQTEEYTQVLHAWRGVVIG